VVYAADGTFQERTCQISIKGVFYEEKKGELMAVLENRKKY
jgi:hypothetical protein